MDLPDTAACYRTAQRALARDRFRLAVAAGLGGAAMIAFGLVGEPDRRTERVVGGAAVATFGLVHGLIEKRRRPVLLIGRVLKKDLRENRSIGNSVTMKGKPFLEPWLDIAVTRRLALAPDGATSELPVPRTGLVERVYDGVYERIREGGEYAFLYSPSGTFLGFFDDNTFVGD